MDTSKRFYKNWMILSPVSLSMIGAGLCMTIDAGFIKNGGAAWNIWVSYGTVALIVFNTGICLFGGAVINRWRFLQQQQHQA